MSGQGLTLSKDALGNIVLGQAPKPTGFTAGQAPSTIEPPAGIQGQLTPQVAQSYQDFINYAQQTVESIRQKIEQGSPTPQEPVVDVQAQLDFLKQQPPEAQVGLRQQLDQWRRDNGMMGFEAERINILKDLQAARESRDVIVKEIEDNPDLPKGLAARRKAEVDKDYNERVQSATNRLQIVTQQIGDLNDQLNMQFKIYESEESRRRSRIDDQRQLVQQFVSSGAIAGFSDEQLEQAARQFATAGYDLESLKMIRDAVKRGETLKAEQLAISQSRLALSQETQSNLNALRELQVSSLTRTAPGQIVNASTGTAVKLTDAQSQFFSQGLHLQKTAEEVKQIIGDIGTSALKGWVTEQGYLVPVVQNALDPKQQALMQKMYDMNNLFVYFSTGKQINETEFNRLSKQTPNFRATPEYNRTALDQFMGMINDRMSNYLSLNGWTISGGSGSTSQQSVLSGASTGTTFMSPTSGTQYQLPY